MKQLLALALVPTAIPGIFLICALGAVLVATILPFVFLYFVFWDALEYEKFWWNSIKEAL